VWTGRQARQIGLVDALGGMEQAIALAKQKARIPASSEVEVVVYPPRKTLYDLLLSTVERFGRNQPAPRGRRPPRMAGVPDGRSRRPALFRRGETARVDAVRALAVEKDLPLPNGALGLKGWACDRKSPRLIRRPATAAGSRRLHRDPHLLLRLHHVGAEEAVLAVVQQLLG